MDLVTYALSKKGIIRIDEKEYKPELKDGEIVYKKIDKPGEYTTFTVGKAGELCVISASTNLITELYINNVVQELPMVGNPSSINGTKYPVNEGDIVKIKGGFSLKGTTLAINNIILQNNLTDCSYMFCSCTSLTEAPVIPNSVTNCSNMFASCTNLVEAPIIPEGVTDCSAMFNYCPRLTEAPVIPNSVTNCGFMFSLCGSLTEAPVIPNGVTDCYYMFYSCSSLTEAPIIPSSVTNCNCMFYYCTNLKTLPQENIDLMNNPPEGLNFENCYTGCSLVADQVLVAWGGNKVEEPEETTYTVTYLGQTNFDGEEQYIYSNKATTVNAGDSFTTTLTAMHPNYSGVGFMVPIIEQMEVWMDGIEITEECGVVRGTEVTITIKNVTGDISIDVIKVGMGPK